MPFQIVRNDLTKMNVDVIVNPANPGAVIGRGTDCAVYEAAGREKLLAERRKIGLIEPGYVAVTPGFKLKAKNIIHAVGTFWNGGDSNEERTMRICYKNVFAAALKLKAESIAFPLMASGFYGFPKEKALDIAVSEIREFLENSDMMVYLVVFDRESVQLSREIYGDIDSFIDENYVAAAINAEHIIEKPKTFRKPKKSEMMLEVEDELCVKNCAEPCAPLKEARSFDDIIVNLEKSFMEMVFTYADERGMTDVEVQKRANIDKRAFSKLKCGTTRNPSKPTALALAIALRLSLDETKDLLARAGYALSPCSRQDLIVEYFITHEAYDINEVNIALFEHNEPTLGAQVA